MCNSCSPHRITIPYQFIVQPPADNAAAAHTRPDLDSARAGSSSNFTTLGGGERVRLCNPCVPDPNVAPPQTTSSDFQHRSTHFAHSRAASLASSFGINPQASTESQPRLPALPSNYTRQPRDQMNSRANTTSSSSYTQSSVLSNDTLSMASGTSGNRSRASTVSHKPFLRY